MEKVEGANQLIGKCRNCGQPIYLCEWRWRHYDGMYTCTENVERLGMRAELEGES